MLVTIPVFVLLGGYFILIPFSLRIIYSGDIPKPPNLSGYPTSMTKYIEEVYAETLDKPYSDEMVGELGMVYHSNFFYKEAQSSYEVAKSLNNGEWRWYYYIALINEELGDSKATVDNLERVVEINPEITNAWFNLGNSYLKQSMLEEAEIAFVKVKNMKEFNFDSNIPNKGAFPLDAYARLNLGRIYLNEAKYETATSELTSLIKEFPRFGPGYRLLGQLLIKTGKNNEGTKLTVRAGDFDGYQPPSDPIFNELILKSQNTDYILKQIDIAIKSENSEWAEILCKHILEYNPNDIEATSKYILVKLIKFDYEGLGDKLKTYYDFYSENHRKLMDMAKTLYRWNVNKFAVKYLERVIEIAPREMEAYSLYIRILTKNKIDDNVITLCKNALEIDPQNSELRTEYGRMLTLLGKEKEAKREFNLALKYNPKNEAALILLGIIAQEKGEVNSALQYFRKSVMVNPLNITTSLNLGNYYLELKKWDNALELFEKSLVDSPNNIDLLERLAWIKAACPDSRIRNGMEAVELGQRISLIRKSNASQDIKCGITLAVSYAEVGNFDRANRVLINLIGRAKEIRAEKYISNIEGLITLFNSKTPYRF